MCNQKYHPLPFAIILLDPSAVAATAHRFDPFHVVQIPVDGFSQGILEPVPRFPAQLFAYLGCIDRIAPVMPRPIGDKVYQMLAGILARTTESPVHESAEPSDDIDVRPLGITADVVGLPWSASFEDR